MTGRAEYFYLPEFQSLDQQRALQVFQEAIVKECDVWVLVKEGAILGFLAMKGASIDRLYVKLTSQRRGVGAELLRFARALYPGGLSLHTHQQNFRARRFYEQQGFLPIRFGLSPAPESVPDVEYRWAGQRPARA